MSKVKFDPKTFVQNRFSKFAVSVNKIVNGNGDQNDHLTVLVEISEEWIRKPFSQE